MTTSVRFTEEMKGRVAFGVDEPTLSTAVAGSEVACMFHLTISATDIDRFVQDPEHEAVATGWVGMDALGGRLPVSSGTFNLFVPGSSPDEREMRYRLFFADGVGNPLTLVGRKHVRDDPGFDVWSDTSTLAVRIVQGHVDGHDDERAAVVAAGILRILKRDFARQLTTFRASGGSLADKARAFALFGGLFAGRLVDVYVR